VIKILIAFEGEWIRKDYGSTIKSLALHPEVDFFIGSVHHVYSIPIDHNAALYSKAVQLSGGTEEVLFADYYDLQYEMLNSLRPKSVGHFDLIKLLSTRPLMDPRASRAIWTKILRNLRFVVEYGGLIEVNSSGLRKGLGEPYPGRAICKASEKRRTRRISRLVILIRWIGDCSNGWEVHAFG
jgi:histidinol-phosphatase (PHP family)